MPNAGAVNPTMLALTPAQVMQLDPQTQAQYLRGMSPGMQQWYAKQQQIEGNRQFMRQSLEKVAYAPVTGGSGTTATYSTGTTLYFDLPRVPGYAKGILITYNLTVTPASGAGATYAVNKAAPFNIFQKIELDYNGPQIVTHPYFACKVMDQLVGFERGAQNAIIAGQNNNAVATQIVGSTPIVVGSGNTWQGKMYVRLNALGNDTVPGVLPLNGIGNTPQLRLTCVTNFIGQDPLLNPIAPVAGTSHSATVTGNINVDVVYLDGTNMDVPTPLTLAWQQEPTIQYTWEAPLTPFNAGSTNQVKTIGSKLKHWYAVAVIIDANQANQFAALSNLTGFGLSPDTQGTQFFEAWNLANNISIFDYYDRRVRRVFGQDVDDGVIPWVAGPNRNIINSDNRNGIQWLNMQQGGYPAATHLYQVGSVSGQSTIDGFVAATPRVEMFLVSENPAGLKVS